MDPNIDYAKLAQGMGWYAEGPITDPKDLGPALKRAVAMVKRGSRRCWIRLLSHARTRDGIVAPTSRAMLIAVAHSF